MKGILFSATCYLVLALSNAVPLEKIDETTAFADAKKDKNNNVTAQEVMAYLNARQHSIQDSCVARLVRAVDEDRNGTLNKEEFEKLIKLRNKFIDLDIDKSGTLTFDELAPYFQQLGIEEKNLKALVKEVDEDSNGNAHDLDEFVYLAVIVETFSKITQDKKTLSSDELETYLNSIEAKIDSHGLKRLIIAADTDNSGRIDIDEFGKIFLISHTMRAFDADKDERLNTEEVDSYLKSVGTELDSKLLSRLMRIADDDSNGLIDLDEFAFIYAANQEFRKILDKSRRTLVSEELSNFFKNIDFNISDDELDHLLVAVANNDNRTADFVEFVEVFHIFKFFRAIDSQAKAYTITVAKLERYLKEIACFSVSHRDAIRLKTATDTNNNGQIEIDEFAYIYMIHTTFRLLDTGRRHQLDKTQVADFLASIGAEVADNVLDRWIKVVDEDKSGKLDLDEFAFLFMESRTFMKFAAANKTRMLKSEVKSFLTSVKFELSEEVLTKVIAILRVDQPSTEADTLGVDEFGELFQSYKFFVGMDSTKTRLLTLDDAKNASTVFGKKFGTVDETIERFNKADTDGNGKIDFEEFVTFYSKVYNTKDSQVK